MILHYPPLIFEEKQIKTNIFWNFSCEKEVEGVHERVWVQQGLGLAGLDQTCWHKVWFVCKCTCCLVSLSITNPLQGKEGTICSHLQEPWADSHLLPIIKHTQQRTQCSDTITTSCKNKMLNHFLVWLTALWGSGRSLSTRQDLPLAKQDSRPQQV